MRRHINQYRAHSLAHLTAIRIAYYCYSGKGGDGDPATRRPISNAISAGVTGDLKIKAWLK